MINKNKTYPKTVPRYSGNPKHGRERARAPRVTPLAKSTRTRSRTSRRSGRC